MYKLFLTFRYLTRKKIVIFPILVVWLCLMMMIIVTSIMGGFVDRVRQSNRDLLGDIIVSNRSPVGWSNYDELQATLKQKFPQIVASTPTIQAYGLITAHNQTFPVQIVGIDPVGRSKVSKFRETLFAQYTSPMNAVEDLAPNLPATGAELKAKADKADEQATVAFESVQDRARPVIENKLNGIRTPAKLQWNFLWGLLLLALLLALTLRGKRTGWTWVGATVLLIVGLAVIGVGTAWPALFPRTLTLAEDQLNQANIDRDRADRTADFASTLPPNQRFTTRDELVKALVPPEPSFDVPADPFAPANLRPEGAAATASRPAADNAPLGCIAGAHLLYSRDARGNFERPGSFRQHTTAKITVVPIDEGGNIRGAYSNTRPFTVIDDSYTGVYDVDSLYVYAPFDVVQSMANLRADEDVNPKGSPGWSPPRCNELLIRLKPGIGPEEMKTLAAQMDKVVEDFRQAHPDTAPFPLMVQTWDQKQEKYLNAVENEKVMQTFILGLMSCVVLVVIFLIFYMIVRDKTRDIGIIKAVGGSEEGVAGIFLTYGLFVGIVGGILGVITGVAFVTHTNQIHEMIYQLTGRMIWDRSVYVFDTIPDTVNPPEVAMYFLAALIAGILGALIPAIVAGSEDPVKAVRYE